MPNVGKPSKACANCRARKVKCDQKRPSCSQCIKVHIECHGYRDPLSLMFRNESELVVTKAHKQYEKLSKEKQQNRPNRPNQKKYQRDKTDSHTANMDSRQLSRSAVPGQLVRCSTKPLLPNSMVRGLAPSAEDQALGFFLAYYVMKPSIVPRGQFEFLPTLLQRPSMERILASSVKATSLASLANATKSSYIARQARENYVRALKMTNKALRSQHTAIQDSTLVSIMLLGMYENLVCESQDSLQQWEKHIDGGCTLLTLYGRDILRSSIGVQVIKQFYGNVLLISSQTGTPIPEGLVQLWEKAASSAHPSDQERQWTIKIIRFIHDVIVLGQDNASDPERMVQRALRLDSEIDSLSALISRVWTYNIIYILQPARYVLDDFYHTYLDPWVATMWNNIRVCRLKLHQVIRAQLRKGAKQNPPLFLPEETEDKIQASKQISQQSAAGIRASTPQLTGQIPFHYFKVPLPGSTVLSPKMLDQDCPKLMLCPPGTFLNPSKPTGLQNLVFPLYVLARSEIRNSEVLQWTIDRFNFCALTIGAKQALGLVEDLKYRHISASGGDFWELSDYESEVSA